MSGPFTILSFGEVLWDLLPSGPVLGGAPLNLAYRVGAFGDKGIIASCLGRDERGREAFQRIAALGMETDLLQWDDGHSTGTVNVSFDAEGRHRFVVSADTAWDYIAATPGLIRAAAGADCLCFGTAARRSAVSRASLQALRAAFHGRISLLDLNLRDGCWADAELVSAIADADLLKLNDEELAVVDRLFGLAGASIAEKALDLVAMTRLRAVVVTLGPGGAFAASGEGVLAYEPAFACDVVDSVGAGDAFTAGFLHELLSGGSLSAACRCGNALGALVAGQSGATQPVSRERIDSLLAQGARKNPDPRFGQGSEGR